MTYGPQSDPITVPATAPPRTQPTAAATPVTVTYGVEQPPAPRLPVNHDMRVGIDGVERFVDGVWVKVAPPEHAALVQAIGTIETQSEHVMRNGLYSDGFRDGMLAAADSMRSALGLPK